MTPEETAPRRRGRARSTDGRHMEKTADGKSSVRQAKADGSHTSTTAYKRYGAHIVERAQVDAHGLAREVSTASRDGLMEKTVVSERRSRRGLRELDPREAGSESPAQPDDGEPPFVRHVTRSVTDTTLASPRTRTLDNVTGYRQARPLAAPHEVGVEPLDKGAAPQAGAFNLAARHATVDNGIRVDDRDTAWKSSFGFVSPDGRASRAVQQAGCSRVAGEVAGCHLSTEHRGVILEAARDALLRDAWERTRTDNMFRQQAEPVDMRSSTLWYYNPSDEPVHVTVRSLTTAGFPVAPGRQISITSGTPAGRPRRIFSSIMLIPAAEGLRYRAEIADSGSPARIQQEARMGTDEVRLSLLVLDPHYATAIAEETRTRQPVQPHQVSDPRDPHNLEGDLRLISQFLADLKGKPLTRESLRVTNRTGRGANHVLVTRFWSEGWAERLTLVSLTQRGERTDISVLETPRTAIALTASTSDGTRLTVDHENVFTLEQEGEKASLPSLNRPSAGLRETVAGGGLSTLCRTLRRISQATTDLPPFARRVLASFAALPTVAGIIADEGPAGSHPALGVGYLSDAGSEAVRKCRVTALLEEGHQLPPSLAAFALAGYGSFMNASGDMVYGIFNDGIGGSRFQDNLLRGGIGWGLAGVSIVGAPNHALWDLAKP